jgi:hypothetical protein
MSGFTIANPLLVCASLVHKPWESIKANESWIDESKSRGKNEVNPPRQNAEINFHLGR